jgi:hypothetical protein
LGIKGYNKIKVLTNNGCNPTKAFAHFFGCPTQSSSMGLHIFHLQGLEDCEGTWNW